jgi:UbiD family decarboxylase
LQEVKAMDLREFVAFLKECGELHTISVQVDREWEVGAICFENFRRAGPALLFERVGQFNTPLLVGAFGTMKRYAMALGTDPAREAIFAKWEQAFRSPVKPVVVSSAPCQEVVLKEVDLWSDPFPVPRWHKLDGGYYLGTLATLVSRDPETGWTNCGVYRHQIFEKDKLGVLVVPNHHLAFHLRKWTALGKSMPVAVAVGVDPCLTMVSVAPIPPYVDEYDIAGGLQGSPLEVTPATSVDLLVPARAEIVIEGEIPIDEYYPEEGPFGESPGYMGGKRRNSHYIRVKKVTHRRNPIFQGTLEGKPPNESTELVMNARSYVLLDHLRRTGIPGVVNACYTAASHAAYSAVVSIQKMYPGHVRDVMANVWGLPGLMCKHVVVVDEDIDPFDPFEVEWAIATRVQADRDVVIVKNGKSFPLDPSQVPSRRGWSALLGIDATKPTEYYAFENATFPESSDPPKEWIERVKERWNVYGFKS